MDIKEVRELRTEAERQINKMLEDFIEKTGVGVQIEVSEYRIIGKPPRPVIVLSTFIL